MSEDALKARINELEAELDKKDREIHSLLDRIEELEDNIMRLDALIPDHDSKKKKRKQQVLDSKLAIELDEKDRQIRDLKNSMGFLRKEKLQLQQELERIKSQQSESSVIRVEDLRSKPPLNMLVKELQDKVNNQRSIIKKLRSQKAGNEDFSELLHQKEEEVEILKSENSDLKQKLNELSTQSSNKSRDPITKELIEDLQEQLTKSKRKISDLKQKIQKPEKKNNKSEKEIKKVKKYKKEINEQKNLLKEKDEEIKELKKVIITLQKAENAANFKAEDISSSEMMKKLKDDLQTKLNKSKLQIKSLEAELKKYQGKTPIESKESQNELEGKLKMQREMAMFLQKQLATKEEEIETIKNEAVQIKRKYRQLENQLRLKDEKLNGLHHQIDSLNIHTQDQPIREDPNLDLRIRELKNKVENLKKRNNEQKLEITQLRKRI
jgi:chromosome segregation ATPase